MCNNRIKYDDEVRFCSATYGSQAKKWRRRNLVEEQTKGYVTKSQMISNNYADNIASTSAYWSFEHEKPTRRRSIG